MPAVLLLTDVSELRFTILTVFLHHSTGLRKITYTYFHYFIFIIGDAARSTARHPALPCRSVGKIPVQSEVEAVEN